MELHDTSEHQKLVVKVIYLRSLIKLNDAFGIMKDDYDVFIEARCKAISRELRKRIIPQEIDQVGTPKSAEESVEEQEEEWNVG
jgi:hypothetical protein